MSQPATVETLRQKAQLQEAPFTSAVPLVGSLVARFREAWHSVAGRWQLRAVIQQQNAFNALLVAHLERLDARLQQLEEAAASQQHWIDFHTQRLDSHEKTILESVRRQDTAEARATSHEAQLTVHERRLNEHGTRHRDHDALQIAQDRTLAALTHDLAAVTTQMIQLQRRLAALDGGQAAGEHEAP